jgi:hypothetical protein
MAMPEIPTEPEPSDSRRRVNPGAIAGILVGVGTLLTGIGAVIAALR